MATQLPGARELISSSWKAFRTNWNDFLKVSIWFLYLGFVDFALYALVKISPVFELLSNILSIGVGIIWFWAMIRLLQTVLRMEDGKKPDMSVAAMKDAWRLWLRLFWIMILMVVILIATVIPLAVWLYFLPTGLIAWLSAQPWVDGIVIALLIVPAIYVGLRLAFAQFLAIDKDATGLKALAQSSDLVRGRWLATFWRQIAGGLFFGIALWLGLSVLFLLLAVILGPDRYAALASPETRDPLFSAALGLLNGVIEASVLPLFVVYGVKLYRALLKNR